MTMATPIAFKDRSSVKMASLLPNSRVSVISNSRRCAARPDSSRAAATMALSLPVANCAGDKLTATVSDSGQAAAGFAQDPGADPVDQTHVLRERNEGIRRDQAAVHRRQAHQCLKANQLAAGDGEHRLIVQDEALVLNSIPN